MTEKGRRQKTGRERSASFPSMPTKSSLFHSVPQGCRPQSHVSLAFLVDRKKQGIILWGMLITIRVYLEQRGNVGSLSAIRGLVNQIPGSYPLSAALSNLPIWECLCL